MIDIDAVRELKKAGKTYAQIGEQFGVSRQRIAQLLMNNNTRSELINSAGGKCQKCGAETDVLHAHHSDYDKDADIVLCASCHRKEHAEKYETYPNEKSDQDYISITDAANKYNIPRPTLKRWCEKEQITGVKKIGSQWAIPANWKRPALRRGNPKWSKSKEKAK